MNNQTKLILFSIIVIILSNLVSASLSVDPSQITQNMVVGESKTIPITIKNNHNFTIYNIEFSSTSHITFPTIQELAQNNQTTINITILTDSSFDKQLTSTISFKYKTSHQSIPQSYTINITESAISPNILTIRNGDTIRVLNSRQTTQTFIEDTGKFTQDISPNSEITINFNEATFPPTIYNFHTNPSFFSFQLTVLNRTIEELTHNIDYDVPLRFTLNSRYPETSLDLTILDTNLTVNHNGQNEGLLRITNTGNKTAKNLTLSIEKWITFNKQNFDIDQNANSYIAYTIKPFITKVEETNKTYSLQINLNSANTPQVQKTIYFFIPYAQVLAPTNISNMTYQQLYDYVQSLISIIQNIKPPSDNQTIIYRDANVSLAGAPTDLRSLMEDNRVTKDAVTRTEKIVNDNLNTQGKNMENMTLTLNNLGNISIENQKSIKTLYQWILIVFILGIVGLAFNSLKNQALKILKKSDIERLEGIR